MCKKILHLTYDMRIGGTETVIKNLVEGIDKEQFETEILCIEPKLGPFGEQLQEQSVKITNLHWTGGFDIKLIKTIRHYIKQNHIDVLHCHQYTPWVYGALAAAFTKAKVIFTEHGRFYPDSSSWKRRFINPVLLAFTNHVTAISKATKHALVDYEFIPKHRIEVIYNGIKPLVADAQQVQRLREQLEIPIDARILGTVARLDPIKNQTMMIEAFSLVLKEHPDNYLLIVGDGEERGKLERLVDKLNIRGRVIFVGYVERPINHLSLMDVFLLPSLSEGTSMTLLEAMSLGIPSIVTNVGGNPEVIIDGENGKMTKSLSAKSIASAMEELILEKRSDCCCMKRAKEIFKGKFSSKIMCQHYSNLYKKLIQYAIL